jgi:hypothetical protein
MYKVQIKTYFETPKYNTFISEKTAADYYCGDSIQIFFPSVEHASEWINSQITDESYNKSYPSSIGKYKTEYKIVKM